MRIGFTWSAAVMAAGLSGVLHAQSSAPAEEAAGEAPLPAVLVTAQREQRTSKGATGLDLAIKDTPQSISVVTDEQMRDFGATSLNDALRLATGINVEEWETNRTNYMARGFEIKNTQVDGIGLPNDWGIVTGAMDAFGYEKIEVIRGANGLLTGVGNSSGTINYVRKRPTNQRQGSIGLTGGSYDLRRLEADYSTPFTASGAWAGRIVLATEDKGSHVRGMSNERTFVYGVIDGQIGERSTLAIGYSFQDANTDGNMWGALVFPNSDGTQAEFDESASTSQDWAFWDTKNQTAFAEYTYALPRDWELKLSYNYRAFEDDSKLFFVYSSTGLDPQTALGLFGWPGSWSTDDDAHMLDLSSTGTFNLFGREHELILGISHATGKRTLYSREADPNAAAWGELPAFPYPGDVIPEPAWGPKTFYSVMNQELNRAYGTTRLHLTEKLATVLGFSWAEYHRDGEQTGALFDQTERELSPYAGITYAFRDNLLGYVSYSDIYQPQDYYDINGEYLAASKGLNYEVGIKAEWLDKRLLTTLAWFKAEQEGLGTFAGLNADGNYYYEGVDVTSKGIEAEITGRLNDYVDLVLGFTSLRLKGEDGADIYEWVPRRTANLALSAKLPGKPDIAFGLNGRWQSKVSNVDGYNGGVVRQGSYATLNVFGRWDITERASARVNINNVTDEKYITSLYQVGFYGAPRNYAVNLVYQF